MCVSIERLNQTGLATIRNGTPSTCGTLKPSFRPSRTVRQLVGVQGGTWLLFEVTPLGTVQLNTVYSDGDTLWSSFSGSLCYAL